MTDPIARPSPKNRDYLLKVELEVRTSDPRLLDGLEVWLRLGLVSDDWVREVARQWLTCPLPVVAAPSRKTPPAEQLDDRPAAPIAPRVAHGFTSITAELSVVWLLLVGAFLVVVSSAWLAASLWSQVGVLGQYGILLLYTIVFWGAALWTDRQEKLRLTGRALRGIVTLLLPVNAWAADGLGLPLWGWAGAGALWAAIAWTMAGRRSVAALVLLACGLHWNWDSGEAWAWVSVYTGAIALLALIPGRWQLRSGGNRAIAAGTLLILLLRALATGIATTADVALVMAVAGLLLRLESQGADRAKSALAWIGRLLIVLGWLLGQVAIDAPWQQLELGAIAAWLLGRRLARSGRRFDLLALTVVVAAALNAAAYLFPDEWRSGIVQTLQSILLLKSSGPAMIALWLPFPIVPGLVAGWQQRRDRPTVARFGLGVAIGILILLNCLTLSLWPQNVRLLVLSLATSGVMLLGAERSRLGALMPRGLVGLVVVHGVALVYAIGRFWLPSAGYTLAWAQLGVGLAAVLWLVVGLRGDRPAWRRWAKACWWAGSGLAGLSLLQFTDGASSVTPDRVLSSGLLTWLLLPIGLLGLAGWGPGWVRKPARILGPIGLVLAQGLPISSPRATMLSLAIATVALATATGMVETLRRGWIALMAVIFGWLGLAYGLGVGLGPWPGLAGDQWVAAQAALLVVMWTAWWGLSGRATPLAPVYGLAFDRWTTFLVWVALPLTTLRLLFLGQGWDLTDSIWDPWIIGLQVGAIGLRWYGGRRPGLPQTPPGLLWAGAWAIELGACELVHRLDGGPTAYGAVTLALALVALLATERAGQRLTQRRWLPLAYGLLAIGFRLIHGDAWTGLLMVGVSLVGLRVAARSPRWPLLSYGSLALASGGWGETALYWASHLSEGGTTTDLLVLLMAMATALAWAYYLGRHRWGRSLFALDAPVLTWTAHGHWLVGTLLVLLLPLGLPPTQRAIALGVTGVLTAYPWFQGWRSAGRSAWLDGAVLQTIGWVFLGRQWIPGADQLDPHWGAIASVVAIGLALIGKTRPEGKAWVRSALWLPATVAVLSVGAISPQTLMVVAATYGVLAALLDRRRWYYLGALFATLSIWKTLWLASAIDPLPYVLPIGGSLILAAEIDTAWQGPTGRRTRHGLRSVGAGAIALAACVNHSTDWLGWALALGTIGVGIVARVRAYLFVGALLLGITTIVSFMELNARIAFLKWLVGLAIGTGLIWVAATFETQRDRANALIQRWSDDLDRWD